MLFYIIVLTFLILLDLIITSVIWCAFGKVFRIDNLTFKKALLTCLLLGLISVAFYIIPLGFTLLKINNVIIDLILSILSLIVLISIIKIKFNTTILKSIGLYVSSIVFVVCFALLIRTFVVQAYKIPSRAMVPTLLQGDHIFVDKFIYKNNKPQRGDIIIFPYPIDPSKDFIKRLIGLEGDILEIRDKQLYINNELYDESYIVNKDPSTIPASKHTRDFFGPITIPQNSLFVMGDNRDNSHDSRFWGFVDKSTVKGKVKSLYWSWDKEAYRVRWKRIGKTIQQITN